MKILSVTFFLFLINSAFCEVPVNRGRITIYDEIRGRPLIPEAQSGESFLALQVMSVNISSSHSSNIFGVDNEMANFLLVTLIRPYINLRSGGDHFEWFLVFIVNTFKHPYGSLKLREYLHSCSYQIDCTDHGELIANIARIEYGIKHEHREIKFDSVDKNVVIRFMQSFGRFVGESVEEDLDLLPSLASYFEVLGILDQLTSSDYLPDCIEIRFRYELEMEWRNRLVVDNIVNLWQQDAIQNGKELKVIVRGYHLPVLLPLLRERLPEIEIEVVGDQESAQEYLKIYNLYQSCTENPVN